MLFLTARFDAYRRANPLRYQDSVGQIFALNNTVTAYQAEYILAIVEGVCQGVFVADEWVPVALKRVAFEGREAPRMIWDMYVGNQLPTPMRKSGVAAPVLYNWKTCQNATGLAQPANTPC